MFQSKRGKVVLTISRRNNFFTQLFYIYSVTLYNSHGALSLLYIEAMVIHHSFHNFIQNLNSFSLSQNHESKEEHIALTIKSK